MYKLKLKEFSFDSKTKFIAPTFNDLGKLTFNLFLQIKNSGKTYNRIVVLAKGGWTMGRNLCDLLDLHIASSIQLISYDGMKKLGKPVIAQPLEGRVKIDNERILVFDDVNDSGESLEVVIDYLKNLRAKEIDCATLFCKPHSKIKNIYFGMETSSWVIFPHEKREFIEEVGKNWAKEGLGIDEIRRRFQVLGLPQIETDYFLRLQSK
jgi:uncharacterized protein